MSKQNLHINHLEDSVVNGGVVGTRNAINLLRNLRNMISGNTDAPVSVSVKWDGSPSLFAGIDPSDGKFFIAKKGIFNKNPKIYKTITEIDDDLNPELASVFKIALVELSKIGIKGVIQGDLLYTSKDLKQVKIDGAEHITFHPNTIVYAIPKESKQAEKIVRSDIGVVWHTTYRGETFETMSASFGEEITSKLKKISTVWCVDAKYQDTSGTATFSEVQVAVLTEKLSKAGKIFNTISKGALEGLSSDLELNSRVNVYINSMVRIGERVGEPKRFIKGLITYIGNHYAKQADTRKTVAGKIAQMDKMHSVLYYFSEHEAKDIEDVFEMYNLIVDAKHMIINKMNNADGLKTLLKTKKGFEVTSQEGFVAIDNFSNNTSKLVDRLQFSNANFSEEYIKGWHK